MYLSISPLATFSAKALISSFTSLNLDRFIKEPLGRTKTVLGRPVEICHPPRSVHIVKRITNEFKAGKRNIAELRNYRMFPEGINKVKLSL